MTSYGVNSTFATNPHAHGLSQGGQLHAGLYAVLEIAIVVGARLRYTAARRSSLTPAAVPDPTKA